MNIQENLNTSLDGINIFSIIRASDNFNIFNSLYESINDCNCRYTWAGENSVSLRIELIENARYSVIGRTLEVLINSIGFEIEKDLIKNLKATVIDTNKFEYYRYIPNLILSPELSRIIKGRPESYSLKSNQFIHLSAPMYYEIKKADIFSWEDKDKDLYRIEAKVELKFSENTLKLFEVGKEND